MGLNNHRHGLWTCILAEFTESGSHSSLCWMPEDSASHVDWKATAKSGSLKVREFAREDERKLCIAFDNPEAGMISEAAYRTGATARAPARRPPWPGCHAAPWRGCPARPGGPRRRPRRGSPAARLRRARRARPVRRPYGCVFPWAHTADFARGDRRPAPFGERPWRDPSPC